VATEALESFYAARHYMCGALIVMRRVLAAAILSVSLSARLSRLGTEPITDEIETCSFQHMIAQTPYFLTPNIVPGMRGRTPRARALKWVSLHGNRKSQSRYIELNNSKTLRDRKCECIVHQ
jgi:hypothetical protein